MKYNPDTHHRRSIRLNGYDYSQAGAYFVTVCTQNRECLLGGIVEGKMVLNDAGRMVQTVWDGLSARFPNMELDELIVMPNHFHGIVVLSLPRGGEYKICPYEAMETGNHQLGNHQDRPKEDRPCGTFPDTLGRIMQAFKSITTH